MISNTKVTQFVVLYNTVQLLTVVFILQFISTQTADSRQRRCLDTNKLKLCLTCLASNPPRQQGFLRADLSPCSALQTVTFMNKLVIIISLPFCYLCCLITLIHLRPMQPVSPSCIVAEIAPGVM